MGRITLTEIEKGDDCDLTATNVMVLAILSGVLGIDDQNIRRGGLDERNFEDAAVTVQPSGTSKLSIVVAGAGTPITNGASPSQPIIVGVRVIIGPIRYQPAANGDRPIIKLSLQYEADVHATTEAEFVFQLGWSTDWNGSTGTWTAIPSTKRVAGVYDRRSKGSLTIAHRVVPPTAGGANNAVYFGLFVHDQQAAGGAAAVSINHLNFYAINHTR